MKIGQLAEATGVSIRSLRYYEEQQLLLSSRTTGGQRIYTPDAVDRVQLIQLLFGAGLASSSVVELLPCIYSGTVTPAMLDRLLSERERIAEKARTLALTRRRLDDVIVAARTRLAEV